MVLTQKERTLLEDLKCAEQLCITKYTKYAEEACDPCLAGLFNSIKTVEVGHLNTVNKILAGDSVTADTPKSAAEEKFTCTPSVCSAEAKKNDAFLCQDALSMEKHVSAVYNTAVFDCSNKRFLICNNGRRKIFIRSHFPVRVYQHCRNS